MTREAAGKTAEGRVATYEIPLDAPPDAVWRALTAPSELERWFPLTAMVVAGSGGRYRLRWRDRHAGDDWPILEWEPERRLAVGMPKPDDAPGPRHVITEFVLEGRGDRTLLRVVASGFDSDARWDTFFDGIRRGWRYELGSLKHYLEHHRGEDRSVAWAFASTSRPLDDAWRAIFGPDGWRSMGSFDGSRPGDRYALTAPDGTALSGTVMVLDQPTDFSGTVNEFNNGLLRIQLDPERTEATATIWLAAYKVDRARMSSIEHTWQRVLDRLLAD